MTNKWNWLIGFTSIWVLIYEVWKIPFFRRSLPERHPRKHWCYWLATTVTNRSYLTLQTEKKKKKAAKAIFNQVFQTSVMKRMPFLSLTTLSDWRKTSRHLRTHSVGGDAFSRAYNRLHIYLLYDWLPSLSSSTVISQSNYGNFGLRRPNESHDREDSVVPLACLIALRTESRSCHSLIRPWCVMRCNLLCMTKLPHADTAILRARDVCKQKSKKNICTLNFDQIALN